MINGTFDTGDFTGWSLVNDEDLGGNTVSPGQGNPKPGAQNGNIELIGGISQPIATVPGRDYRVMFDLLNPFPETGYNGAFLIGFGGQDLMVRPYVPYTGDAWSAYPWKTFAFDSAKVSDTTTTLFLLGRNAHYYNNSPFPGYPWGIYMIDNVRVYQNAPGPLPALGLAFTFQASRRLRKRLRRHRERMWPNDEN